MLAAFVFSASAQVAITKGSMEKVGQSHLKSLPYSQLKQQKDIFAGWIFPSDIATNLNSGADDFYDAYSQPIWPDSTVATVSATGKNYVWMHSIAYTFDARSSGLDENLSDAPVGTTVSYKVDSLAIGAWYEVRNGKYDTLLIEVGAVDITSTTALLGLQLGVPDTSLSVLKVTSVGTQQYGVGTSWNNLGKQTIKYTLTENDSTLAFLKYINIAIPSTITVNPGQVLGVNVTFIPGTSYTIGDTLMVYGQDAIQSEKLNSFLFYYMSAKEASGAAFFDPFGKNLFQFNHSFTRYQTWTGSSAATLNQCLYPEAWGASLMAFKVSEVQSISKNNTLQVNAYPNPAQNILNVDLATTGTATVSIVNLVGQSVKEVSVNQLKNTINISDLSAGMYMLKVSQNGKVYTNKFVVK